MDNFNDININQAILTLKIKEYFEFHNISNFTFSSFKYGDKLEYYENSNKVLIEFYFKENGTTTIKYKLGKNPDLGKKLAIYLYENALTDQRSNLSVTIANIDISTINNLKDFFNEQNKEESLFLIEEVNLIDNQIDLNLKSLKYKDSIHITYYKTTKNLQIQGKPLYTHSQVSYFLSEYCDLKGYLQILELYDKDKIDKINSDNIKSLLNSKLNNSIDQIPNILITLLENSLALDSLTYEFSDYGFQAFPALRALEGVIKNILIDNNIQVDTQNKLSDIFEKSQNKRSYIIKSNYTIDSKLVTPLCDCYNYYKSRRHELFHMNDVIQGSRMITNKQTATTIIETIIKLTKNVYDANHQLIKV